MKIKYFFILSLLLTVKIAMACEACEKQQPKFLRGITHGTGPQSNWDWVIIGIITVITALTFIFSLKYLIWPGEKNTDHIKQIILDK